nr:ribosomal protein L23 [Abelia chinensis var. ionandra]
MDGIKYAVFTDKSIRLLSKNQYTSNVESGSTRTEIKHWVELFFGVKVIAMNVGDANLCFLCFNRIPIVWMRLNEMTCRKNAL